MLRYQRRPGSSAQRPTLKWGPSHARLWVEKPPSAPRRIRQNRWHGAGGSCPASAGGNLRIEQDGLGLPLLVEGAKLSRHLQRVACLDSLQHASCLRLLRRIGRRIDELRRFQELSVGFEFEAHPRDIAIGVGRLSRRLPT